MIIIACSIAAIPFASSFYVFLGVSLLFGLGMSVSTVATSAYVADVAKKEHIGASMGALSSIMDIGQSAGPLCTGIVIGTAGYSIRFFPEFRSGIGSDGDIRRIGRQFFTFVKQSTEFFFKKRYGTL